MSDINKGDKPHENGHSSSGFSEDKELYTDEKLQQVSRENDEPEELNTPVPLFILLVCALLIFFGGFYFARYSGGFKGDVFDPNWQPGGGGSQGYSSI